MYDEAHRINFILSGYALSRTYPDSKTTCMSQAQRISSITQFKSPTLSNFCVNIFSSLEKLIQADPNKANPKWMIERLNPADFLF